MGVEWFYLNQSTRVGPLADSQLRQLAAGGVISPRTPILRIADGVAGPWRHAAKINGLFPPDASHGALEAICEACGSVLSHGQCRACAASSSPPPLQPQARSGWRDQLPPLQAVLKVSGVGLIIIGALSPIGVIAGDRFRSDNAVGATANAVEAIQLGFQMWLMIFAGLGLLMYAKLRAILNALSPTSGR